MRGIATRFLNLIKKNRLNENKKAKYIFYKIVGKTKSNNEFILQCINTKATFSASITDIVHDISLLYSLHPIQSCYIGIEYATYFKQKNISAEVSKNLITYSKHLASRYGNLIIHFQDRNKNVCFLDKSSHVQFIMDPLDLAFSSHIEQFDASDAFLIGMLAGNKIHRPNLKQSKLNQNKKMKFRIIR